ncbi:MAG: helix-turn-helix transcriptional regulator [Chloroflexota bacterium]
MAKKHLVADRIRRVWRIVEDIAQEPGKGRKDLADKYSLSERQVQDDLNLIRADMHLPLVRHQGYRFEAHRTSSTPAFTLREAQLLLLAVRQLGRDRAVLQRELTALLRKLPSLFPPHLKPLADRILLSMTPLSGGRRNDDEIFDLLSEAAVRKAQVQLHYPTNDVSSPIQEPIVRVELLVPYSESWYLIGQCQQRNRLMMFDLENVVSVTPLFRR